MLSSLSVPAPHPAHAGGRFLQKQNYFTSILPFTQVL